MDVTLNDLLKEARTRYDAAIAAKQAATEEAFVASSALATARASVKHAKLMGDSTKALEAAMIDAEKDVEVKRVRLQQLREEEQDARSVVERAATACVQFLRASTS